MRNCFASQNILNKIDFSFFGSFDIIYGYKKEKGKLIFPLDIKNLKIGIMFANHQSMFFNKSKINTELYYNEKFKIYADYELINRIYKTLNSKFQFIDLLVADYEGGGVSASVSIQKRIDKYRILYNSYGIFTVLKALIYRVFKMKYQ